MRHGVMLGSVFFFIVSCAHSPEKKEPERMWNTSNQDSVGEESVEISVAENEKPVGDSKEEFIALTPEPSTAEEIPEVQKQKVCATIERIVSKTDPEKCQLKRSADYLSGTLSEHQSLCENTPAIGHPKVVACLEKAQTCDHIGECFDLPVAHYKRECSDNVWIDFEVPGRSGVGSSPATVGLLYSELEEHYDYRYASAHLFLANIKSSEDEPIEVCGPLEMMDWLMHLQCPDGTKPMSSTKDTHTYKTGISQAGRCDSRIHNFEIPCGSKKFSHHIDMGACPPGKERYPNGLLKFKKRYRQ